MSFPLKELPGPKNNLLWDWRRMRKLRTDFLRFLAEMTNEHGPVCSFRVGHETACIINDSEMVHEVLTSRATEFRRTRSQKRLFGRIVGNGLIVSDGEHWQRQRRLAQPAFHQRQVVTYVETMQQIASQHVSQWPVDEHMDFDKAVTRLTLHIVAVTLLGSQPPGEIDKISDALSDSQRAAIRLMKLGFPVPFWLPTRSNLKLARSVKAMNSVILPVIAEKRRSAETTGDLLSMFIAAVDSEDPKRRMTDEQVRDEAVTMFLAGHDTTANLLTWTVYLLCRHPDVYAKLQQEVDDAFGNQQPNVEGLRRLTYSEMVLREVLRLYPPVYLILREPVHDMTLGGYQLKKGQMLMLSPWLLHRDPRNFDDPELFNPLRFGDKSDELPAGAYIPFGAGSHQCIGRNFATLEALVILATMARRLNLRLCEDIPVEPDPLITLRTRYGLNVLVTCRGKLATGDGQSS